MTLTPFVHDGTRFVSLRDGETVTPPTLPTVQAISADTFRQAFGTRVFPSFSGKTGEQMLNPTGRAWLEELRPGFLTHRITPSLDPRIITFTNHMWTNYGCPSMFTVGQPQTTYTSGQWDDMMGSIEAMQDAILCVTGQNEVNHERGAATNPPPGWAAIAIAHQAELWSRMSALNAVRVAASKPRILVGNPNLWSGTIATHDADAPALLPHIKDYADCIVWHLYTGRGPHPDWHLDEMTALYRDLMDDDPENPRPIICSEAGYFVAPNYTGGSRGNCSPWAHSIYLRKLWLEYAIRGHMVSQFEFVNDPDPTGANREASFGLVKTTTIAPSGWSKQAAFDDLKAWLALTGGTDGPVQVDIQTQASTVRTLLVNHSTGTRLFAWRAVDIEDAITTPETPKTLTPATIACTVTTASGTQIKQVAHDVTTFDL